MSPHLAHAFLEGQLLAVSCGWPGRTLWERLWHRRQAVSWFGAQDHGEASLHGVAAILGYDVGSLRAAAERLLQRYPHVPGKRRAGRLQDREDERLAAEDERRFCQWSSWGTVAG